MENKQFKLVSLMHQMAGKAGILPFFLFLLVFILQVSTTYSSAQGIKFVPEEFSEITDGQQVYTRVNGTGLPCVLDTVIDGRYSYMQANNWRIHFKHRSVNDFITITVRDSNKYVLKYDYIFLLKVDTWDYAGRHGYFHIKMRFSYDPQSHKPYTDKSIYHFKGAHKFAVHIDSMWDSTRTNAIVNLSQFQKNFSIEQAISIERYYLADYMLPVSNLSHTRQSNKVTFRWNNPDTGQKTAPSAYELEWTFVDTFGIPSSKRQFDFKNNSTRVLLYSNSYTLNLIYDGGVLLYRVRKVRPDSVYYQYLKYSSWFPTGFQDTGHVAAYTANNRFYIAPHEAMDKNWDYSITYAEEGLHSEVINYFDGSLKRRQGVTLSNSRDFALVDESVYDYHGRESIKILPAPSDSNIIKYYDSFNLNRGHIPYGPRDFDSTQNIGDICDNYKASPLDTTRGAGRYYSPANPDKTAENAAIPDAQGFPLVQTQLMPDPTGRIRRQGGVGPMHQLGTGHETRYYYGGAEREAMEPFFGSEVGNYTHYKSNGVVDPNGQTSISYVDQHGRVIATALAGGVPGNLDTLTNFVLAKKNWTDLANKNKLIDNSLNIGHSFRVDVAGNVKLYYGLSSPGFIFGCLNLRPCYQCVYNLQIRLTNDCSDEIFFFNGKLGRLSDTTCHPNLKLGHIITPDSGFTISGDSIQIYLPKGEYRFTKVLTVNTDSLDYFVSNRLEQDTCIRTLDDFVDDALANVDYENCVCDTCSFDSISPCEQRKMAMMMDVNPMQLGQYAAIDTTDFTTTDYTSIFYGSPARYKRLPVNSFRDENGKPDTVLVYRGDDTLRLQPQQLTAQEFYENWDDGWAGTLIRVHPEYCYYRYCVDTLSLSEGFIDSMMDVENYDDAYRLGFLNPLGNSYLYPRVKADPLFVKASGVHTDKWKNMWYRMSDVQGQYSSPHSDILNMGSPTTKINLWQFSRATGACSNITDSFERQACFNVYGTKNKEGEWMMDDNAKDQFWLHFKSMYMQMRQQVVDSFYNVRPADTPCIKKIGPDCSHPRYRNKFSRFVFLNSSNTPSDNTDSIAKYKQQALDSLNTRPVCEANLDHWAESLKNCPGFADKKDSILTDLLDVCRKASLNPKHPNGMGATDIPGDIYDSGFKSFNEVLEHYLGSNYKSVLCNLDLVNSPSPSNFNYFTEAPAREITDCHCNTLKEEILKFKNCENDSLQPTYQGRQLLSFFQTLKSLTEWNDSAVMRGHTTLNPFARNLFTPVLGGGDSSNIMYLPRKNTSAMPVNERLVHVAWEPQSTHNNNSNKTAFYLTAPIGLNISSGTFTILDIAYSDEHSFNLKIAYGSSDTGYIVVDAENFTAFSRCEPTIIASEIDDFTSHLKKRFGSNFNRSQVLGLLGRCGNYGGGYCHAAPSQNDRNLMKVLNEFMRPDGFVKDTITLKRFLTDDQDACDKNTDSAGVLKEGQFDLLLYSKTYRQKFALKFEKYHNYWWEGFLGPDTNPTNNYFNDPYFKGGAWIGAKCSGDRNFTVKQCFLSFGDPYEKLGSADPGVLTSLDDADSLSWLRYDYNKGEFLVTASNRSSHDSIWLSFNTCFTNCKPGIMNFTYSQNLGPKYGNVTINGAYRRSLYNPLVWMLTQLGKGGKLTNTTPTDLSTLGRPLGVPNFYASLYASNGASKYYRQTASDSLLIGWIGSSDATDTIRCQIGLRKLPTTNFAWGDLKLFKELTFDSSRLRELFQLGQLEQAGYYFRIKGGTIPSPGDTNWYDIRGWMSCKPLYSVEGISVSGLALHLPQGFAPECGCYTCPEIAKILDTLQTHYPDLYPSHPNYASVLTNHLNRFLQTNLSFAEYQTYIDGCDIARQKTWTKPVFDLVLRVKDSTTCGRILMDSLESIMDSLNLDATYKTFRLNTDSTWYGFDLSHLNPEDQQKLVDAIAEYLPCVNVIRPYNPGKQIYAFYGHAVCDTAWFGNKLDDLADDWCSGNRVIRKWYNANSNTGKLLVIKTNNINSSCRQRIIDSLWTWDSCGTPDIHAGFYIPVLKKPVMDETICLPFESTGHDTCITCSRIHQTMKDFQYDNSASVPGTAAMQASNIRDYIKTHLGISAQVIPGTQLCSGCSEKTWYVCSDLSDPAKAMQDLLIKLGDEGKLGTSSYSLGGGYTSLLNKIKSAFTTKYNKTIALSSPTFSATNNDGGITYSIRLNSDLTIELPLSLISGKTVTPAQIKTVDGLFVWPDLEGDFGCKLIVTSIYGKASFAGKSPVLVSKCCVSATQTLCPQSINREKIITINPCREAQEDLAVEYALKDYTDYIDSLKQSIRNAYTQHCLEKAAGSEAFGYTFYKQRYHYTLYYYDQAGNLIKTVPPAGVQEITYTQSVKDTLAKNLKTYAKSRHKFTNHGLSSLYRFNSLNQPNWQSTPDGGISRFWYDRLGRLVASQNAQQKARSSDADHQVYSYTKFDALGRMIEVGEVVNNTIDSLDLILDSSYYHSWVNNIYAVKTQITRTFYDTSVNDTINDLFGTSGQRNLRGRVSTIAYYDYDSSQYNRATHFSYDIHGNVYQLFQDFPEMEEMGHRYKTLVYNYDLVSGRVHSVAYQPKEADQWYHRYQYDADNRLVLAETSLDSTIWDMDAEYHYYKHGPLARTVLGEHAVQGVDYAYTIHGWIKAVNSNTLNASRDIGKDGTGEKRLLTARDAVAFSLGFYTDNSGTGTFDGDYKSIGTTSFEANTAGSPLADQSKNLYNGNISHMVTAISVFMETYSAPLATSYRYDQLNRIKSVYTYSGINLAGNSWNSGSLSGDLHENFSYDPNGNIQTLVRHTTDPAKHLMDSLIYHYQSGTNQLTYVDDGANSSNYSDDVDDQNSGNYKYDKIGNLSKDKAEQIDTILWNVYGKIKDIKRFDTANRGDLEFRYDAAGQRVFKIVKPSSFQSDWKKTWYVRDAQGNIMAVYDTKTLLEGKSDMFWKISKFILDDYGSTVFKKFIADAFSGKPEFKSALIETVVDSLGQKQVYSYYTLSQMLGCDTALAKTFYDHYCDYSDTTAQQSFNHEIWNNSFKSNALDAVYNCGDYTSLITAIYANDNSDEFLNWLSPDVASFNQLWLSSTGNSPPFPPTSTMIAQMRAVPVANLITATTSWVSYATVMQFMKNNASAGLLEAVFHPPFTLGKYNFCDLMEEIKDCGTYNTDLANFIFQHGDTVLCDTILVNETDPTYFLNTLATCYPDKFSSVVAGIKLNWVVASLKKLDNFALNDYLKLVYKHLGKVKYQELMAELGDSFRYTQRLELEELHIYGSSRLGMSQPKRVLLNRAMKADTNGLLTQDTARDSINYTYTVNYKYSYRKLTYKQYELSNHLGNVLATVLDRKTAVVDTNSTGDTVMYYVADVYTAQAYYAFGSSMPGLSFRHDSVDGYRYGFNNQEKENELGDYYSFEYRVHDARLGRFLSVDPLQKKYCWNSPYSIAFNSPLTLLELEGLEGAFHIAQKSDGTLKIALLNKGDIDYKGFGIWCWGIACAEVEAGKLNPCGDGFAGSGICVSRPKVKMSPTFSIAINFLAYTYSNPGGPGISTGDLVTNTVSKFNDDFGTGIDAELSKIGTSETKIEKKEVAIKASDMLLSTIYSDLNENKSKFKVISDESFTYHYTLSRTIKYEDIKVVKIVNLLAKDINSDYINKLKAAYEDKGFTVKLSKTTDASFIGGIQVDDPQNPDGITIHLDYNFKYKVETKNSSHLDSISRDSTGESINNDGH